MDYTPDVNEVGLQDKNEDDSDAEDHGNLSFMPIHKEHVKFIVFSSALENLLSRCDCTRCGSQEIVLLVREMRTLVTLYARAAGPGLSGTASLTARSGPPCTLDQYCVFWPTASYLAAVTWSDFPDRAAYTCTLYVILFIASGLVLQLSAVKPPKEVNEICLRHSILNRKGSNRAFAGLCRYNKSPDSWW